ncbi:C-type lectin domain family 2 member D11, partial [Lemmus lemmus]
SCFTGKTLREKILRIVFPVSPARLYCCYAVIIVLTAAVIALSVALSLSEERQNMCHTTILMLLAQKNWIAFENKCFYFSEDMENWTYSQNYCRALGTQLAQFDNMKELVRNDQN